MLQIHASAHEFQSIKHRAVSQNSSVLRTRADHSTDDWSLKVLDGNDSGAVSLEEFVNGIIRMKGSTQSKHMFFVHSDLHTLSKRARIQHLANAFLFSLFVEPPPSFWDVELWNSVVCKK